MSPTPYVRTYVVRVADCCFPNSTLSTRDRCSALQVRIYQVKKEDPLGRDLKTANSFDQGKKRKKSKPLARRKAAV